MEYTRKYACIPRTPAKLIPRTPAKLISQTPAKLSPRTKQPARTLWVSFAPAALNRRPRFRPAMVRPKTRKWSALIFADHVLSPISYLISIITSTAQNRPVSMHLPHASTPDTLHKLSISCASTIISLQIPSTYVTSDAFSRQFCYRNHLPVLCQHRYICVFGERRASLHLYID